jgi:hypothetical protein
MNPFQMLSQRDLERNEMLLLKNERPVKENLHYINVPLIEGFTQGVLQARLYPHGTLCTSPFK